MDKNLFFLYNFQSISATHYFDIKKKYFKVFLALSQKYEAICMLNVLYNIFIDD